MTKPARNHVIIIDGTQSRLEPGQESNAGQLYRLIEETKPSVNTRLWYNPGIQGHTLWNWVTIASGLGLNETIKDAYGWLSAGYRPGDRVFLFGFSRGGYAVRSLAGMINRVGLLRRDLAIERNVAQAFRIYENQLPKEYAETFCQAYCHDGVEIEMIGVWDTVKALGIPYPVLSRLAPMATEFHDDKIGGDVRHGFHALALDETRAAFAPVLWRKAPDWDGVMEQVWFCGTHSDVGGHVWRKKKARGLANIPLVWMLERAEGCGLKLPKDWKARFPCDVTAPSVGNWSGMSKFFVLRKRRILGRFAEEYLHASVPASHWANGSGLHPTDAD